MAGSPPLYERVKSVLAGDIADGRLPPETQLASEDGLVARFKVSRTTVRKAIQNLVERGLVEVRRGKGTFVTQPKITQELTELTGFVEDMQALGRTPTTRLLDKCVVAADETVARHLALAPRTLVVRLQRVRLADDVAMSFDETYLPRELGAKVAENDLAAEPVFALLEIKYDTPLIEAEYELGAIEPPASKQPQPGKRIYPNGQTPQGKGCVKKALTHTSALCSVPLPADVCAET
jgi:GntR family transcriptional regulator